jgi:hypothetical protein
MRFSLLVLILAAAITTASSQTAPTNMDSLMSTYWQRIVQIQKTELDAPELAVPIDTGATLSKLDNDLEVLLERNDGMIGSLGNDTSLVRRHFDAIAISMPNIAIRLQVLFAQQRVKYLSKYLRCCPADSTAWKDFTAARSTLEHLAHTALLAD